MSGTDDLNSIIEDEKTNRGIYQIIPVNQGIDQQLFKDGWRDLGKAGGVYALPG
jgi:hypothetical protein